MNAIEKARTWAQVQRRYWQAARERYDTLAQRYDEEGANPAAVELFRQLSQNCAHWMEQAARWEEGKP